MGFPTSPLIGRAAMVAAMLAGGLLYAGISQAQDAGQSSGERGAELVAATGGPASDDHLIAFAPKAEAVEARDDDVAPATPDSTAAPNAAEAAKAGAATRRGEDAQDAPGVRVANAR